MAVFDAILGFVGLVLLGLVILAARRFALQRGGGTIDVSLRLRHGPKGRGWALGIGRYDGDRLVWYRVFSFFPRPRRTVSRSGLTVVAQRRPSGPEALSLLSGSVILDCRRPSERVELALSEAALPGFLAWLEAAPAKGPEIS